MDDVYTKKLHECIKRTLLLSRSQKFMYLGFCFVSEEGLSNCCQGSSYPITREEEIQNRDLMENSTGRSCYGCPFLRYGSDVTTVLSNIRNSMLLVFQDNGSRRLAKEQYYRAIVEKFFRKLLNFVKLRCYLTFTQKDYDYVIVSVTEKNFNDLFILIDQMYNFCKENNI